MFGPPFEDPADVHTYCSKTRNAGLRHNSGVAGQLDIAVPHKAVGDGYAELTGQMVVAGPRRRSAASGKSRQLRADRRSRTSGNDVVLPIPCANYAVQILGSLAFLFAAGDNIHLCLCAGRVRAHSQTRPALGARRRPAPHRGCFWPQL